MGLDHWMRVIILSAGLGFVSLAAHAGNSSYVCTALKQDAGREDADMSSALYWWDDGRLRMVEIDQQAYYHGADPAGRDVKWLDIYAVPNGHGSTFLGYYLKQHFKCQAE